MDTPLLRLLPLLFLAGCMTQTAVPVHVRDLPRQAERAPDSSHAPLVIAVPRADEAMPPPGPLPVKAINANIQCAFKDETGVQGRLDLQVENASIRQFSAQVSMPHRGICRFDLRDFQQTATLPAAVLASRRDACSVRLWEQGPQLTVAFSQCAAQCSGEAFDYLWPILADRSRGTCS